ncbi:hypothetical protein BCV70DRAFT_99576 [Testicularia cyperi]|uniref:Zn(2)-C6 fungal-type domain-containing protein n=1 Tax=Testicularia cyperi TaxID=1882483 RepID=A0A317XQQ7_9BASI|nr:hypothetical protein BCV70DRAFT_99576 [Testicularia cyperi]
MPPAKCDVIPKGQLTPFAERRACSGCRRIKSRCIFPDEGNICTRCARLNLECVVPSHHRGVRLESQKSKAGGASISPDQNEDPRSQAQAQQQQSSSLPPKHDNEAGLDLKRPLQEDPQTAQQPASSKVPKHQRDDQGRYDDEAEGSTSSSTNPFSVQSLLDTTSNEQSASKALLSSTSYAQIHETPSVKLTSASAGRPLIDSVITAGIFDHDEVADLVQFYYDRLNPIIALLDSTIYSLRALKTNPDYRILLAAICTVSAKFIKVRRYIECLDFLKPALSRIAADDVPPQLEIIQSLSILAMWKHPKDGSSWRKVRLAITQAFELGLHELFGPQKRSKGGPSRTFVQTQRTLMQLSCFEDGYHDQRHLPPALDPALLPDPREWLDSLGDMVTDMDVRLAASRENANIKRELIAQLKASNARGPSSTQLSRATCLRNARLIRMTITAQTESFRVWANPPASGIPSQHSGRPCLLFHNANTLFNYYRALYSIYSSAYLSTPTFADDRQAAFQTCSELAVELFELLNGPYGQAGYYRYVHDIVILNLAVAAVWICDNWRAMNHELAIQACSAIRQAADATSPTLENHLEQGSYLARFLRFCCKKLPSTISINENSPVNAEDLVISEDAIWALGLNPFAQSSLTFGSTPPRSGGAGVRLAGPSYPSRSGMPFGGGGSSYHSGMYMHGRNSMGGAPMAGAESVGSHVSASGSVPSQSSPDQAQRSAMGDAPFMFHDANGTHAHSQASHGHGHHPHHTSHSHHAYTNGHSNSNGTGNGNGNGNGHGHSSNANGHHAADTVGSGASVAASGAGSDLGGHANNLTMQYLSDSLVPPSYPMNWDTVDDNSIITFLQSISNAT